MTRAILLILFFVLLAGAPLAAQTVPVRVTAGEHADFTRVVAQSNAGLDWEIERTGRQITLRPTSRRAAMSLEGLFDRIPRTRLASARMQAGTLVLDLNCDCPIDTFTLTRTIFVIDIGNPPATLPADLPTVAAASVPAEFIMPDVIARRVGRQLATGLRPAAPEDADLSALTTQANAIGEVMARAVAQGISSGLLEMARPPTPGEAMLLPIAPAAMPASEGFVTIRDPSAPVLPEPAAPSLCDAETVVAPLGIPSDVPAAQRLATAMGALYGEFDALDPVALEQAAMTLLSLGLGFETRLVLSLAQEEHAPPPILLALADVIEDLPSNARMTLSEALDCPGVLGVFALIAAPPVPRDADWHMRRAFTFAQFPAELRLVLAERVFERHIDAGATDAARLVVDAMLRSGFFPVTRLAQFDARLEAERGDAALAGHRLQAARWTSARDLLSVLALDPAAISDRSDALSAEALATAERLTPEGRDLMTEIIRQHAAAGRFVEAFEAHDRMAAWPVGTSSDRALADSLMGSIWQTAAETLDPPALLELLLLRPDWRAPTLDPGARVALSARLSALGIDTGTVMDLAAESSSGAHSLTTDRDWTESGPAQPGSAAGAHHAPMGADAPPAHGVAASTLASTTAGAIESALQTPGPEREQAVEPAAAEASDAARLATVPPVSPTPSPRQQPFAGPSAAQPLTPPAPATQPQPDAPPMAEAPTLDGQSLAGARQTDRATATEIPALDTPQIVGIAPSSPAASAPSVPVPGSVQTGDEVPSLDAMELGERVLTDSQRLRESLQALLGS